MRLVCVQYTTIPCSRQETIDKHETIDYHRARQESIKLQYEAAEEEASMTARR